MRLIINSLIALSLLTLMLSSVYAQPPTVLWFDGIPLNDITISKDGQYVAAAESGAPTVRFYSQSGDGTPIWTRTISEDTLSVAISADGDCVVVGGELQIHFWKNARSLTGNPPPTWTSTNLGRIEKRGLDISDDGNYVAACGSGESVFYWANAKTRSSTSEPVTWNRGFTDSNVECLDLSSDGDYVAAGVKTDVAYWKNARSLTGNPDPAWYSTAPGDYIIDIAISDDGDYIAAAGTAGPSPLYYWANAKTLIEDPVYTWDSAPGVDFNALDMSSDGDSIFAGGSTTTTEKVYFWTGARSRAGTINPTWTYTTNNVVDVSMNVWGDLMAAGDNVGNIHYFDNTGDKKWTRSLGENTVSTSISGDGGTLAVATTGSSGWLLDTGFQSSGPTPVGGLTIPINKLQIMTPYIAFAITIAALLLITKKSKSRTLN
ncbi:WD40 repeat domain-containing protein [Thermoproteota archaeon]